jgi:DNA-binding transcriptional LysR family regulator
MLTFKQLEALYWVVQAGGFSQAAQKLHTSTSAVSKRVHELEAGFDLELFDRTQRTARLTEKGEEMFVLARKLLEQRDAAIDQIGKPEVIERRVRIGVTEFTASLHRHALRKIARLVHIGPSRTRRVIRQQLQRNVQDR